MRNTSNTITNLKNQRDPLTDFDNSYEFYAKLMFIPNVKGHEEYDNNFTTTNLRSLYKEPEEARSFIEALNILQRYYKRKLVEEHVGFREQVDKDGKIVITPVYEKVETRVARYGRTHDYFLNRLRALVMTSKVRDGFTVREFNKRKIESTETIEEKTESKKNFFGQNKY